jgi:hypothetical protein
MLAQRISPSFNIKDKVQSMKRRDEITDIMEDNMIVAQGRNFNYLNCPIGSNSRRNDGGLQGNNTEWD